MANEERGELFLERRLAGASEKLLGSVARATLLESEVDGSNTGAVRIPRDPKTQVPHTGARAPGDPSLTLRVSECGNRRGEPLA
jgi:hypothetical protein